MILVTGGAYQGKTEFARMLCGERGLSEELILDDAQDKVRHMLAEGRSVADEIERMMDENPDAIIICDEVGSGVVPMDASDNVYREAVGRAMQAVAGRADEVYRVYCGIGARIK